MERKSRHESRRVRLIRAAVVGVFLAGTLLLLGQAAAFVRAIRSASMAMGQSAAAACLVLEQSERDVGTVTEGTPIGAAFPVRNAGNRRLVVNDASCGACDGSGRQPTVLIEPGQVESIRVEQSTTGRRGSLRHVARYTTNDPKRPRLELVVQAQVTPRDGASIPAEPVRSGHKPESSE